ncbi:MAG: UDP-2,3-diacylglucosamine diphosphatase [Comamonas sp.]
MAIATDTPAFGAMADLAAPAGWSSIEIISDLHLQPSEPHTFEDWQRYLQASTAGAVFILGDLFEAWVGDDALLEPGSFEAQCAALLRQAAAQRPLFFMHGNRDFLIGDAFAQAASLRLLPDPTPLAFLGRRYLLSHGDALCLDDVEYQRFRAMARSSAWQAQLLAQPLAARRQLAGQMRSESTARQQRETIYTDVDTAAALAWLDAAQADTLVHGHTHRPAEHALDAAHRRVVLSDWDTDTDPPRAEVLRIDGLGLRRIALADYLRQPPQ